MMVGWGLSQEEEVDVANVNIFFRDDLGELPGMLKKEAGIVGTAARIAMPKAG